LAAEWVGGPPVPVQRFPWLGSPPDATLETARGN
jgi:hypothetical protein